VELSVKHFTIFFYSTLISIYLFYVLYGLPQSGFVLQVNCRSVAGSSRQAFHTLADQHEGEVEQGNLKVTPTLPTLPTFCGHYPHVLSLRFDRQSRIWFA
jgi:hypothetical protein